MTVDPDPASSTPGRARLSWRSAAFVVLGNLIPIFGVVVLDWNAVQILLLFWCENVITGVMTLPRIVGAQALEPTRAAGSGEIVIPTYGLGGRTLLALFFVVHYGLFCLGHGFFTSVLLADRSADWPALWSGVFAERDFRLAILGMVAVQMILLVKDWLLPRQWRRSGPREEMIRPYGRILILHMTVIVGAWVAGGAEAPTAVVLVLCLVKAVAEILALSRRPEPAVAG